MLVIQDPTNEESTYLLESLLNAFHSAEKIAGAFGFASAAGVQLFTEDASFRQVAQNFPVDLVVGIDAVTNHRALDKLLSVSRDLPNVNVRAFLNPRRESLFHPKFCWTKNPSGGHLIAGSGNLTEGGLLGNWEAYSVEKLDLADMVKVEATWDAWTKKYHSSLFSLDNEEVRRIAANNNVLAPEGDLPTLMAHDRKGPTEEPDTTQFMPDSAAVLVAEIPKSGDRWKQVNFHLEDYQNFFGVKGETARLVVFRHVKGDGTLDDYEKNRPPVTVRSRNFRFELAAAAGIAYPDLNLGRPIGVYIRVATRTFFYRLLLPNDIEFQSVSRILNQRSGNPGIKMRSVRMTVEELRQSWARAPFWKLPKLN